MNRKDIQPVVEVVAKRASGDELLEVSMRGGDDTHVDVDALWAAEPLDLTLLEHSEQLHLNVCGKVTNLVEKIVEPIRQFESSGLPRQRSGERSALTAEQLAFDERRGNRRAVDTHHRMRAPCTQSVQLGGKELLAGAGFAEQQHGRVCRGDLSAAAGSRL